MKISPMTPRFLQEAFLNICIIVGAIVGIVGLVCLVFTDLSKVDSALVTVLGAAIFFGFRKVKTLRSDYSEAGSKDEDEGAR